MCAAKTLCFYHPTTVVIVDDNKTFLENLPDNLNDAVTYKLFDSPKEALAFLEAHKKALPTPEDFLGITEDFATGESLNVNIPKIRTCLNNSKRFETPTVLIIDHDMPEMSGFEFCKTLGEYPIKKIMLTGAADHKLAIQAFNDGLIQKFVTKDDANVFSAIDEAVQALQQEYFSELSALIVKNITTTTFSFLANSTFQNFFKKMVKENNIAEFYLIDAMGSFLFRTHHGALGRIIVQSEEEIENYHHTAKDHDAPAEVIQAIASKEKLLCLFSEEDFNQPVANWKLYLHPAHKIEGLNGGYYAMAKE